MRTPRAVVINGWNSYIDGHCTLTRLSCPIPDYVAHRQTVEGLDGDLDFSEAAVGRPVYQSRQLDLTFESSYGNRADRLMMFQALTDTVHGQLCRFDLPDRPGQHLEGRATVKLLTDAANYIEFSVSAVCSPFFVDNEPTTVSLPVLGLSDNLIRTAQISYYDASSNPNGSHYDLDGFLVPASIVPNTAVWEIELSPNTTYYFAASPYYGRGVCSLSLSPTEDRIFSGEQITTDETGIVYLRLRKISSEVFDVKPVCIFPAAALSHINVGALPADASPLDLGRLDLTVVCAGQCQIRNSRSDPTYRLPAHEQDIILWVGSLPLLNAPTVPDALTLSWRRSSL